jgi:hypothetical protein
MLVYLMTTPYQRPATAIVPTTVATEIADAVARYDRCIYRKHHDHEIFGFLRQEDLISAVSVNLNTQVSAVPTFDHSKSPRTKNRAEVFAHTRIVRHPSKRMAFSTSKPIW